MSLYLKRRLAKTIARLLKVDSEISSVHADSLEKALTTCMRHRLITKKSSVNEPQIHIRLADLKSHFPDISFHDVQNQSELRKDSFIQNIDVDQNKVNITLEPCQLCSSILKKVLSEKDTYGYNGVIPDCDRKTIVVEYSSPNIAKPFHAGHLRSTIIGNFISNLYEAVGHKVIRINYLGDWGTQFGLLAHGYKKYGSDKELSKDPMKHLFEVYVKINKDLSEEKDNDGKGETHRKSLEIFRNMETGEGSEDLKLWRKFRDLSIDKYKDVYERLNIKFTDYEGESLYSDKSLELIKQLRDRDLLHIDESTGQGYVDISDYHDHLHKAVLLKSDGTSLYLSRDIAAVLDRHKRYQFDDIHYVVENGQHLHFEMFIGILQKLNVPWIKRCNDFHIKFGRISNLSTRKGQAVFLEDILNEAKDRMVKTIRSKETSKEVESLDFVADTLGVSSIIIQDLKEKRLNSYKFSWDKVLSFKGQSGVVLQYAHARLCSLIRECGYETNDTEVNGEFLREQEAVQLIECIASYEDAVNHALESLEAHHIAHYLFNLGNFISAAHRNLRVKGQQEEIAKARLQMFMCAKITMSNGMKLLGIRPLDKM